MKPILYRYKDTEAVIKVMDGYTPGEGWTPLFDEETMKAATDAALERAAVACESLGMTTSGIYERNHECASAIRALKDADTC